MFQKYIHCTRANTYHERWWHELLDLAHHEIVEVRVVAVETSVDGHRPARLVDAVQQSRNACTKSHVNRIRAGVEFLKVSNDTHIAVLQH